MPDPAVTFSYAAIATQIDASATPLCLRIDSVTAARSTLPCRSSSGLPGRHRRHLRPAAPLQVKDVTLFQADAMPPQDPRQGNASNSR
jgi:hypothetical protein